MARDFEDAAPLLESSGPYLRGPRPKRDHGWAVAFAVVMLVAAGGGIAATLQWNPDLLRLVADKDWAADPASCPYPTAGAGALAPGLALHKHGRKDADAAKRMLRAAAVLVPASLGVSVGLGAALLLAFRQHAQFMTALVTRLQVALPAAAGVLALLNGLAGPGAGLLGLAALTALALYVWRDEVALCGRLLAVSAAALNALPSLLGVALGVNVVSAVAGLCFMAMTGAGAAVGVVVPNPLREGARSCVDPQGAAVACCAWHPAPWGPPYAALATAAAAWATLTLGQLRVFVTSGAVAQWYYAHGAPPAGATLGAVRNALGPSFGSIAFGGAVMALCDALRSLASPAPAEDGTQPGVFAQLLGAIASSLLTLAEFLTKFATVAVAISGDGLVEGARGATSLLRRVALSAAGVWFFPPLVLHSFAAAAGVAWGALAGGLYAATKGGVADLPREAVVLGAASGFTAWLVLAFFSGVLLSVVDAVFYCYALDRDTGATTRSDVHEVLDRVPCGVVVQNPGGGLAYGARRVAPGSLAGGGAV